MELDEYLVSLELMLVVVQQSLIVVMDYLELGLVIRVKRHVMMEQMEMRQMDVMIVVN